MWTMLWLGGAAAMFGALCCVPFLLQGQLRTIAQGWVGIEGRGPVPLRHRLRYHASRAQALGVALLFFAVGASYLYLVGLHLEIVKALP
ncbi:MAG: hypothetical protein Q8Q14_15535 [Gemmatimonadales bacterium]|nr:hypothetical protein [Gemmatimonadales bacterium]